jgi:hypothetical protein
MIRDFEEIENNISDEYEIEDHFNGEIVICRKGNSEEIRKSLLTQMESRKSELQ